MKKFIGNILMIALVLLFSLLDGKAQTIETVQIKLSVNSNVINVDSLITNVNTGTIVVFYTNDPYTFTVTIDNYDHFFVPLSPKPSNNLYFNVSSGRPVALTVDSPADGHETKYFFVGIYNPPDPAPEPPEAPPRIILRTN